MENSISFVWRNVVEFVAAGIVSLFLLVYLVYTLIYPEKF